MKQSLLKGARETIGSALKKLREKVFVPKSRERSKVHIPTPGPDVEEILRTSRRRRFIKSARRKSVRRARAALRHQQRIRRSRGQDVRTGTRR